MRAGSFRIMLLLSGMRSNACRERLSDALRRVAGVKDVSVSLIRGSAVVLFTAPCNAAALIRAVKHAGNASEGGTGRTRKSEYAAEVAKHAPK